MCEFREEAVPPSSLIRVILQSGTPHAHPNPAAFDAETTWKARGDPTNERDRVRFRVSDVFLASQEDSITAPPGETELEGAIIAFSDSGMKPRAFAVVELASGQTIVVPVEKLKRVTPASSEDEG